MEEKAQKLLSKNYAPAVRNRLARFPSRDQWTLAAWLIKTPIGTNYALQIMEHLEDLSRKEDSAPARLLTEVLKTLPSQDHHPKQLGKKVRDTLFYKLHPLSSDHREKFQEFTRRLGLSKGVQLQPPKNFEGLTFTLEVKFQSPEELSQKLEEVRASLSEGKWDGLGEY